MTKMQFSKKYHKRATLKLHSRFFWHLNSWNSHLFSRMSGKNPAPSYNQEEGIRVPESANYFEGHMLYTRVLYYLPSRLLITCTSVC